MMHVIKPHISAGGCRFRCKTKREVRKYLYITLGNDFHVTKSWRNAESASSSKSNSRLLTNTEVTERIKGLQVKMLFSQHFFSKF